MAYYVGCAGDDAGGKEDDAAAGDAEQKASAGGRLRVRFVQFSTLVRDLPDDEVRFPDELDADARAGFGFPAEDALDDDSKAPGSGEVGVCGACQRRIVLTAHHLIPKSEHRRRSEPRSFLMGSENLLMCCRPCHSMIHRAETNAVLAAEYHTAELLLQHPKVKAFAAWAGQQSGSHFVTRGKQGRGGRNRFK